AVTVAHRRELRLQQALAVARAPDELELLRAAARDHVSQMVLPECSDLGIDAALGQRAAEEFLRLAEPGVGERRVDEKLAKLRIEDLDEILRIVRRGLKFRPVPYGQPFGHASHPRTTSLLLISSTAREGAAAAHAGRAPMPFG